jgi:hypothetical protein
MNPDEAVTVLPPKVRAAIYLVLILASAVLTPLMAAGVLPSLYGSIVLSLMGVFGGTTALANVRRPVTRLPDYDPRHDVEGD